MNYVAATKSAAAGKGAVYTSSQTATLTLDTLGYAYASIDVIAGPAASTSSVFQTLTLTESDASTGTYSTVSGFSGDLKPAAYAGQTATDAMTVSRLDVDLRGKKRYLRVVASPNTDTVIVVSARLGRGEAGPVDATGKGVKVSVES
jgi:hypothetical protein